MEILLDIGKVVMVILIVILVNKICTKAIDKIIDIAYERVMDD